MSDEPFVMLSLKGDKAKKLAHALTNKSADKILAYLANKKDASESQIAKALKLPVSTVNYTMKVLVDAKLVVAEEYHYSEKGREVNHYKLAKKYIIIAPDDEGEGFFQRIKKYVPAFGITIGIASVIRFFQEFTTSSTGALSDVAPMNALQESARAAPQAAPLVAEVIPAAMDTGAEIGIESAPAEVLQKVYGDFVDPAVQETANVAVDAVADEVVVEGVAKTAEVITQTIPEPTIIIQNTPIDWFPYFLLGAFVFFTLALLFEYWRKR